MIKYKHGSIFDSKAQVLVNPVNIVGVMGAGLAKKFKEKYPLVNMIYMEIFERGGLRTGELNLVRDPYRNYEILLFPTKKDWRNPSKSEYVEEGLKFFVEKYVYMKIKSIAFPKLGCGLGGLDWESEVKPLMEKYLEELPIDVEIWI